MTTFTNNHKSELASIVNEENNVDKISKLLLYENDNLLYYDLI
jgi:hypothetical protein